MVGLCLICSCCEYAYLVAKCSKFAAKHGINIAREKRVWFGICRYEYDLVFLSNQICHRCAIVIVTDIYHGEIRFELNDDHHRHCHDKTFDKFRFWILILRPPSNNLTLTCTRPTPHMSKLGCSKINKNSDLVLLCTLWEIAWTDSLATFKTEDLDGHNLVFLCNRLPMPSSMAASKFKILGTRRNSFAELTTKACRTTLFFYSCYHLCIKLLVFLQKMCFPELPFSILFTTICTM